jgi:glucans biosynthesis protein
MAAAVNVPVSRASSLGANSKFAANDVDALAEALSLQAFAPPTYKPPTPLDTFGYDEYRDIRFRPDQAVWQDGASIPPSTSLQFFLSSFIHQDAVEMHLVEDGVARHLDARRGMFDFGPSDARVPKSGDFAFSGFRVHGALNHQDIADEIIAFNGASYFRALGRGHTYGLSARGLALKTIGAEAEEFPKFTSFWIEKPFGLSPMRIHALLDSPSVTGAYHFVLQPGSPTVIDIEATLFPRKKLDRVGLAPLTSMFLFDSRNHQNFRDFREAVHDSDGLAIETANGEHIWRPLLNPATLQTTFFDAQSPRRFGLVQRKRRYEQFYDLEAHYETRPSAWAEPVGYWGAGTIELVEIPSGAEWGDNIVAYWRPQEPLVAWRPFSYSYRLYWGDGTPQTARRVMQTRVGLNGDKPLFVIDYEAFQGDDGLRSALATTTAGTTSKPIVQRNVHSGGIRCFFTLDPQGHASADLRLALLNADKEEATPDEAAEIWMYRWVG